MRLPKKCGSSQLTCWLRAATSVRQWQIRWAAWARRLHGSRMHARALYNLKEYVWHAVLGMAVRRPHVHISHWAEARLKIARVTLTIKLDGNWSSFQLANSAPPLSVTDSAIAPSARISQYHGPHDVGQTKFRRQHVRHDRKRCAGFSLTIGCVRASRLCARPAATAAVSHSSCSRAP